MRIVDSARSRRDVYRSVWCLLEAAGLVDGWGGSECRRVWDEYLLDQEILVSAYVVAAANRPPPPPAAADPADLIV